MTGIGQQFADARFVSLGRVPLDGDRSLTTADIENAWLGLQRRRNRLEFFDGRQWGGELEFLGSSGRGRRGRGRWLNNRRAERGQIGDVLDLFAAHLGGRSLY